LVVDANKNIEINLNCNFIEFFFQKKSLKKPQNPAICRENVRFNGLFVKYVKTGNVRDYL
jgi:hypothetical protein